MKVVLPIEEWMWSWSSCDMFFGVEVFTYTQNEEWEEEPFAKIYFLFLESKEIKPDTSGDKTRIKSTLPFSYGKLKIESPSRWLLVIYTMIKDLYLHLILLTDDGTRISTSVTLLAGWCWIKSEKNWSNWILNLILDLRMYIVELSSYFF